MAFERGDNQTGVTSLSVLPIEQGGTGASTAAGAVANLGVLTSSGAAFTGAVGIPAGTEAAPSLFINNDPNTGVYSPTANTLAITTDGEARLTTYPNGNVNIGTDTLYTEAGWTTLSIGDPTSTDGQVRLIGADNTDHFIYAEDNKLALQAGLGLDNSFIWLVTGENSAIELATNATTRMTIDENGNVGIGENAPINEAGYTSVTIGNAESTDSQIIFNSRTEAAHVILSQENAFTLSSGYGSANGGFIQLYTSEGADSFPAESSIRLGIDGALSVLVDPNSNVGIGSGSTTYTEAGYTTLSIGEGTTNNSQVRLINEFGTESYIYTGGYEDYEYYLSIYGDTLTSLIFSADGTEHLRITKDGNLVVGDDFYAMSPVPTLNNSKVFIYSDEKPALGSKGAKYTGVSLQAVGTNGREYRIITTDSANTLSLDAGVLALYDNTAGAARLVISSGGNVGIGTATPARKLHVSDVMRLEPRNGAPSSPAKGDIYFDSADDKLKCYDGTNWQNLF